MKQVTLTLLINAIEVMSGMSEGPRHSSDESHVAPLANAKKAKSCSSEEGVLIATPDLCARHSSSTRYGTNAPRLRLTSNQDLLIAR